jgi:hypothetical protein
MPAMMQTYGGHDYGFGGLGALDPDVQAAIDGFLRSTPAPSSAQIGDFLKLYSEPTRSMVAQALIAGGVSPADVAAANQFLSSSAITSTTIWGMLAVASAAASGYHGYRRNQSIPWAMWWFFMGGVFPVLTPVIAVAQGFGKKKVS